MLNDIKAAISESVVVGFVGFVFLFAGVFGAVNWNSHCRPQVPEMGYREAAEQYAIKVQAYEDKVQRIGADALIPWVWAVPLTIVGLSGAAVCACVIIYHNS